MIKKTAILLVLIAQLAIAQNNLITLQIDGSRLIESTSQPDSGVNILGTLVHTRNLPVQVGIKVEAFPAIKYYRLGFGPQYKIPIYAGYYDPLIELSIGVEIGMIYRFIERYKVKNMMRGYYTYAINGDILFYIPGFAEGRIPIIATYNYQRRTDFDIYNAPIKFVGSLFVGIGYAF